MLFYVIQGKAAGCPIAPTVKGLLEAPNPDLILEVTSDRGGRLELEMTAAREVPLSSKGPSRMQQAYIKFNAIRYVCGARCEAIKEDFVVWHGPPHALQWVYLRCPWEGGRANPASSPTGDSSFFILVVFVVANRLAAIAKSLFNHVGWLYKRHEVKATSSPPLHLTSYPSC